MIYPRYIICIQTKGLQMYKISLIVFALFAALPAQAQTIDVLGRPYERNCVQEALRDACRPSGSEFASDLIRVPGVGSRVGECAVGEIAHCAAGNGSAPVATQAPAPAPKAPATPGRGRGGARRQ